MAGCLRDLQAALLVNAYPGHHPAGRSTLNLGSVWQQSLASCLDGGEKHAMLLALWNDFKKQVKDAAKRLAMSCAITPNVDRVACCSEVWQLTSMMATVHRQGFNLTQSPFSLTCLVVTVEGALPSATHADAMLCFLAWSARGHAHHLPAVRHAIL